MYGAILGDMIGAPYEFDRGDKTKDFPLFGDRSEFTDDSVMTIAVAEALMDSAGKSEAKIRKTLVSSMRRWGRRYPDAGYGARFIHWLWADDPQPYGSYGNGSAMRVSAAGWLYGTLEEARHAARLTAEVTHNHPEGIKGAEATASAIFLARTGHGKEEIKDYIIREFGYDLSRTCDEIRPAYHHVETCQETVPEAVTAFLEGESFEDVIRTAVSLGGDCDTLTAIAGSIAEAFYGVPAGLKAECVKRLPDDMRQVLERFDALRGGESRSAEDPFLIGNTAIEEAIDRYYKDTSRENLIAILETIRKRMHEDGHFMIPVIPPEQILDMVDPETVKVGDTFTVKEASHFKLHHLQTEDGKNWLAAFTGREEYEKGEPSSLISFFIDEFLKSCRSMPEEGVILNPWGNSFLLTRDLIRLIFEADKPENHIYFEMGDITKLKVDAIVNAANQSLRGGGGVDGAIHRAADPGLDEECAGLGGCETGEAKISGGWLLPAKYVIHTVGPRYKAGDPRCAGLLYACYRNSLELAKAHDLHTIAFPAISTGAYGYPKQEAAVIALRAVSDWLSANPDYGMAVILVCRDQETRTCYQNVIDGCAPGKE